MYEMTDGLTPGAVVAKRFAIEKVAGSGGMGTVFRARDTRSDEWVALKVMHQVSTPDHDEQRFLREARVLFELRHPGIVSYVDHGHTESGQPYLAMQWLDGEDLSQVLRRRGLKLSESLTVARQTALALAVAHKRGIVHRDLKPSNLFLAGGDVEQLTVLDFGVARRSIARTGAHKGGRPIGGRSIDGPFGHDSMQLTAAGMVVGTPEYMAPEQARGQHDIGPAADVFSLGCVLFECLTGQAPFAGEHIAAVLAKILFDDAPKLRKLRPALPPPLEALLGRMLAKNAADRPRDAEAVLQALDALGSIEDLDAPIAHPIPYVDSGPQSLQSGEQQLVSVLYATEPGELADEPTIDETQDQARLLQFQALRSALQPLGVRAERLADGSLVATVTTSETQSAATDQAAVAARGAIYVHAHWPAAAVAISTGRGVLRAELPIGEAVDRAARLLQKASRGGTRTIVLDATTAGLLDARFELSPGSGGSFVLLGEQANFDVTRLLLGKPTPCVGREQELLVLSHALTGCIEDSAARAVLVVSPSGLGKSRLRHEFLRMLEQRPEEERVAILYGRAEVTYTSSPYGLLGQALRRFFDLERLRDSDQLWQRLRERVATRLPESEVARVTECLGELMNLPEIDLPGSLLRGARAEPRRLVDLVSSALCDYLRVECAVQPLLLVLEDLQWADAPSLRLSEAILRGLAESPILLFGLGRPEMEERFPKLWQERGRQEIRLAPLGRRASERLVKGVLGPGVAQSTVSRIVEQAAGNALFLEELIRAAGEGSAELPETVLAMLQARIGRLDATARRVLRAASVFGDSFRIGGLRALLGPDTHGGANEASLRQLIDAEILEMAPEAGDASSDGRVYHFRHSLLREAAYGLLTDTDRTLGHRLAAVYLESEARPDPQVIAEHYERAGENEAAARFFIQATELAIRRSELAGVEASCDRIEALEPTGELLGRLHALRAQTCFLRGDLAGAVQHSRLTIELVPSGGETWYRGLAFHFISAGMSGQIEQLSGLIEQFERTLPSPEARGMFIFAGALLAMLYIYLGMRESALGVLARVKLLSGDAMKSDAFAECFYYRSLAATHYFLGHNPWLARDKLQKALAASQRIQHQRNLVADGIDLCFHDAYLGDRDAAEARLREFLPKVASFNEPFLNQSATMALASVLAMSGQPEKLEEAQRLAEADLIELKQNLVLGGVSRCTLGNVFMMLGQLDRAVVELEQAAEVMITLPGLRPLALAFLLQALIKKGRVVEANRVAAQAEDLLGMLGHAGIYEPTVYLGIAEAHMMAGEKTRAEKALRSARTLLLEAAAQLPDDAARQRYLHNVPYHARVMQLAAQWLDEKTNGVK